MDIKPPDKNQSQSLPQVESSQTLQAEKHDVPTQPGKIAVPAPPITELLKDSFVLFKKGFWRFLLIEFLGSIILPLIITGLIAGIVYLIKGEVLILLFVVPMAFYISFLFSMLWKYAISIKFVDQLDQGIRKIPFKSGSGFVLGLLVFGFIFGILINIGFLLLIIPGVYLALKYSMTPFVYVLEEKRIFKAASLSGRYMEGYYFSTLARFLVFGVVWVLITIIATVITLLIAGLGAGLFTFASVTSLGSGGDVSSLLGPASIIGFVLAGLSIFVIIFVAWIFQINYFYKIYEGIKSIKQQAWANGQVVYDGYTLGKKILISVLTLLLVGGSVYAQFQKNTSDFISPSNTDYESLYNSNLNDPNVDFDGLIIDDDLFLDSDSDGINDGEEVYIWGTNPKKFDTDGDGNSDKDEILDGLDPRDPTLLDVETFAWQSVENLDLALRVKYPDPWVSVVGKLENGDTIIYFNNNDVERISIKRDLVEDSVGTLQWIDEQYLLGFEIGITTSVSAFNTDSDTIFGVRYRKSQVGGTSDTYDLITKHGNYIYTISATDEIYISVIDAMLSTVEFIEEANTDLSSDDIDFDSDGDGLTDYDEMNIWNTDPNNPDSDGDNYLDGQEVLNGYNPLGDGSMLSDEFKVDWLVYRDEKKGIEVSYPLKWELLDNNQRSNGIDISLRDKKYDGSFEWPGLRITNSNLSGDFEGIKPTYKGFRSVNAINDVVRVVYEENGKVYYASCALYIEPTVIDLCNQIFSTFKIIN